jgi:hypothetical protein
MNEFDIPVENLLRRINLIKQIETIAEQKKSDYSWVNDKSLKSFIDQLEHHVSRNENDWKEDNTFLELVEAVNNQIITRLNGGEKEALPDFVG